ncbi:hypothetical protein [Caulobacter sp. RL271]|jgi:hypothetical protein|uniref:Uncharacterized protein n=1 Tax=Caulobacter segnis TaxID=88688 RepID=A0ABY4ZUK6_9CAUL|nr:hypothetical protein [Caulobacter segnis]USQ96268.1 hypothetical protein MZV50_01340 [Caulobacter segnis]
MSKKSVGDLIAIARAGGGFELSANDYTPEELEAVANKLVNGARMTVRDTGALDVKELAAIAQSGPPGSVFLVF